MSIDIDIRGLAESQRALRLLAIGLRDLRALWPRLVPVAIGWLRLQFESEGAWGGRQWAPLSPAYAVEKARRYPGRSILIAEGELRRSASYPRRQVTPTTMTLTISDPKAGFHQAGTNRMPARPLVPATLPLLAQREVDDVAEDYVRDLVRRALR